MVTIHKLLFTEALKLSSSKIMSSFQRTSCAKRPARSTRTLISQNHKHKPLQSVSHTSITNTTHIYAGYVKPDLVLLGLRWVILLFFSSLFFTRWPIGGLAIFSTTYTYIKDRYIYLIFDAGDGAVIAPIKVSRKVIRRQDRCLLSIRRELEPPLQPKEVPPELGRSKVGELGDAVDGGGVELLVSLGAAEVSLEDGESVIVLLLGGVGFGVLGLEEGEVVVGVEERVVVLWRYYLLD